MWAVLGSPLSRMARNVAQLGAMKRLQRDNELSVLRERRRDEFDVLLRRFETPSLAQTSALERWERLSKQIVAYNHIQALIAHMTAHGSELHRATLLLRPWTSWTMPLS